MHLGVTRWSLFVVFSLHNPIIRRWRRKWSKSLINLLSCLEVLIRKLNTSTIWIFSASYFWTSLSDLLSIFVADAIIYDCFILLINSAVCLWWMTLTWLAHTVFSCLCASVISSDEIASSRRGISARLSAWYGHQILLTLGLVMRLLHFLLHKPIGKAEQRFFSWNMALAWHARESTWLADLLHVHRASHLPHAVVDYCIVCHDCVA